jgi:hypothetical protein
VRRMKPIRTLVGLVAIALAVLLSAPSMAYADGCRSGWSGRPYGDYCRGGRWGRYGAKDPVKTAQEARTRLEEYYADEDVVVGKITEHELNFEAEIDNQKGEFVDRVVIDKRSGRIRSVY